MLPSNLNQKRKKVVSITAELFNWCCYNFGISGIYKHVTLFQPQQASEVLARQSVTKDDSELNDSEKAMKVY